jgi:hypothetical protein
MRNTNALPFTAFQDLPVKFSYTIDPKTRRVDLVISTTEAFAPLLMDGLQVLTQLAEQSKRFLEMGAREKRTDEYFEQHKVHVERIRAAYWSLRNNGVKQRAALHLICEDASMPYHGRWKFSDYAYCVKSAPRPAPTLKTIPKQPTNEGRSC